MTDIATQLHIDADADTVNAPISTTDAVEELIDGGPDDLAPAGAEVITVAGPDALDSGHIPATVRIHSDGRAFPARLRLDTPRESATTNPVRDQRSDGDVADDHFLGGRLALRTGPRTGTVTVLAAPQGVRGR